MCYDDVNDLCTLPKYHQLDALLIDLKWQNQSFYSNIYLEGNYRNKDDSFVVSHEMPLYAKRALQYSLGGKKDDIHSNIQSGY